MPRGRFFPFKLDEPFVISGESGLSNFYYFKILNYIHQLFVDPGQTPHSVACGIGIHCLSRYNNANTQNVSELNEHV